MAEERATDILREEHQPIRRVVAAMVVLSRKMETGQAVNPETLRSVIEFMRLTSETHERKEENYLFPALEQKGVSPDLAPVRSLLESHRRARELTSELETAANSNAAGWLPLDTPVLESLRGLADLYPMHLWEEDMILYHLAERNLGPEDDERLLEGFRRTDEIAGEADVRGRFEELAGAIERGTW